MGLGATIVLQCALLATGGETYAEAHKATTEKGCPLVVVIGATWCPACQQLKSSVLPEVKRHGILQKVAFAQVDLDEDRELGKELTEGGPIPQIVMFRKTSLGWRLKRLIGGQDVRAVEDFINQGVDLNENAKTVKPSPDKQSTHDSPVKARSATEKTAPQPKEPSPTES
jgi:thioredoxin-like negative regulator of GroEL